MKLFAIGATALCLSLAAVAAFAQNVQGPGGANYGAGSSPQNGGAPNTQAAPAQASTTAHHSTHHLYNNASANGQSR